MLYKINKKRSSYTSVRRTEKKVVKQGSNFGPKRIA